MQLDAILEVAIGLVFAWIVLSVATMQAQEAVSNMLNWRAKALEGSMREILKDDKLVEQFYNHPLIQSLCKFDKKGRLKKPASIPAANFSAAVMDVCLNSGQPENAMPVHSMSFTQMRKGMAHLRKTNPRLEQTLNRLMPGLDLEKETNLAEIKIANYRRNIENWFDNVMARATTEYKQRAQLWAFVIGTGIALIFNIDTINIANQLWREPALRGAVAAQAEIQVQNNATPTAINQLVIPVGWSAFPANGLGWAYKILGLALSGAATVQGAPFWFDILRKLVGLKQPESKRI